MSGRTGLFGRPQQAQARHLIQFKAGKMTLRDDNWVHADPRKGWVYIYQAGDGKLHFCWIDRKTCLVEDNFVINAKQAQFKKVSQCTTGRVYLLKFKGLKRFFIWMQEPNGKNDSDICMRINDYIKSPPTSQPAAPPSDWLSRIENLNQLSHRDLLALLSMGVGLGSGLSSESDVSSAQATAVTIGHHLNSGHLDESNFPNSLLSTAASSTGEITTDAALPSNASTHPPPSGRRPDTGRIQLQDLRNILSSISTNLRIPGKSDDVAIELNDVLNVENLKNLLSKPEVQTRLLPHLPVVDPDTPICGDLENLTTNIQSSQFKSTLKSFSSAFRTGELAPVLAQFNLGLKADEAARRGDLVTFSHALQTNPEQLSGVISSNLDEEQNDGNPNGSPSNTGNSAKNDRGSKMETDD